MEKARAMEDVDITATNIVTAVEEDAEQKITGIGAEAVVVDPTVILLITVGHTEYVIIRENIAGPQQMATKRTQYGVTRCRPVRETAPDRSVRYLLIKRMQKKLKNRIHLNYNVALL